MTQKLACGALRQRLEEHSRDLVCPQRVFESGENRRRPVAGRSDQEKGGDVGSKRCANEDLSAQRIEMFDIVDADRESSSLSRQSEQEIRGRFREGLVLSIRRNIRGLQRCFEAL